MKYSSIIIVSVGLALTAALSAAPACAQARRTFVSPTGSDSNPCTITAPCRNLQAALAQTAAGGEVSILGTAGYNGGTTVTITQAVSIVNEDGYEAGINVPSGGAGIVISAGASDAISLRGLTIEGAGVGVHGIQFNTGASLTVENCVIRHLSQNGIFFIPNASSQLWVSHSLVSDNANDGIFVAPSGSGTVSAMFNHVEANNNSVAGIDMDGEGSTGTVKGTVSNSVASGNNDVGFVALTASGHAPTTLMVFHSVAANNLFGIDAEEAGAIIRLDQSMVTGNSSGWAVFNSGSVLSYGNNSIDGNASSQTAPPSIALK
jgi:Right handed beta helix region